MADDATPQPKDPLTRAERRRDRLDSETEGGLQPGSPDDVVFDDAQPIVIPENLRPKA